MLPSVELKSNISWNIFSIRRRRRWATPKVESVKMRNSIFKIVEWNFFSIASSVTRWLDYSFNNWAFTTMEICPIAYFFAKVCTQFGQIFNKRSKTFEKMWNFAKSGHTKFVSIMMNFLLTFKAKTCPPPEFPTTYLSLGYWISWHLVSIALRPVQTSLLICCDRHIKFPTSGYRHLLLKLDTQPRSHLVVKVCIQQGIYTAPHPLQHDTPPPPGAMPRSLQE